MFVAASISNIARPRRTLQKIEQRAESRARSAASPTRPRPRATQSETSPPSRLPAPSAIILNGEQWKPPSWFGPLVGDESPTKRTVPAEVRDYRSGAHDADAGATGALPDVGRPHPDDDEARRAGRAFARAPARAFV